RRGSRVSLTSLPITPSRTAWPASCRATAIGSMWSMSIMRRNTNANVILLPLPVVVHDATSEPSGAACGRRPSSEGPERKFDLLTQVQPAGARNDPPGSLVSLAAHDASRRRSEDLG